MSGSPLDKLLAAVKTFAAELVNSILLILLAIIAFPIYLAQAAGPALLSFLSGEKILFMACLKTLKASYPLFIAAPERFAYWENRITEIEKFSRIPGEGRYDLSPIFRAELNLFTECPDQILHARYWAILDRFERVTNSKAAEKHRAMLAAKTPESITIRADVGSLLATIHNDYIFDLERERSIRRLKIYMLALFALTAVALVTFADGWPPRLIAPADDSHWRAGMAIMFALGVLGALISIFRRVQGAVARDSLETDPVHDLGGLAFGYVGLTVALLSGGIFAIIAYLLLKSQMFGNGASLFPGFQNQDCAKAPLCAAANKVGDVFGNIATALDLTGSKELAKMLVWAFLAGFSERLVPDVLDRITAAGQKKAK